MLSKLENRIFVLGNSGSGKSWLSGTLADYLDIKQVSLDDICWEPGGFYKSRNEDDVVAELREFSNKKNWVIEGVYGNFAEILVPRLTHLFWLDLDSNFCAESVTQRGFENIPWMNTEAKIQGYLNHIRSYPKTEGSMSRTCHEEIYNSYKGKKNTFKSRDEVNEFIESLGSTH